MNRFFKCCATLLLVVLCTAHSYATPPKVEVINRGVGGNSTANMLSRVESDIVDQKPDLTIIMVGTNDLLNSKKINSYEKYEENYNALVEKIKSCGSEVMVVSSLPADGKYLSNRHDTTKYAGTPEVIMATAKKIAKRVARKNRCYFVDLHGEFVSRGLPQHNEDPYIRNEKNSNAQDGVHPTAKGYELISEIIWSYIERKKLEDKYTKIICFGDSITRGSGAKAGEDYPSRLQRKFDGR